MIGLGKNWMRTTGRNMEINLQNARWSYKGITLELQANLVYEGTRYSVPTYGGEGWAHVFLKVAIAAHLLHWKYKWADIQWEFSPENIGQRRADIFAKGSNLPTFWFECRTTDAQKLGELRSLLPAEIRIVHVMPAHWFLRWWNGVNLGLKQTLGGKEKRDAVRNHRAETTVIGVEYWAISDTSETARILFAVRPEGNDRYTYFDTGEGWTLSHIAHVSKQTDRWLPLIAGLVGGNRESGYL